MQLDPVRLWIERRLEGEFTTCAYSSPKISPQAEKGLLLVTIIDARS